MVPYRRSRASPALGGRAVNIRERHLRVVSDTMAAAIEGIRVGEAPTTLIPQRLREELRADTASYGWLDTRSGACHLITWPDIPDVRLMITATATSPHKHPVLGHWLERHSGVAVVSELVSDRRAWRNSEGYSLLKRGIGCTETGGIRLDTGRHSLRSIGLARDVDFTPDEVQLLNDIRQPTIAITAHADWVASIQHDEAIPHGVLRASVNAGLTTRELEVLQHLATGALATTIASQMKISARTVHRHLANIYRKLGTRDRLTTVLVSQQAGLLVRRATP